MDVRTRLPMPLHALRQQKSVFAFERAVPRLERSAGLQILQLEKNTTVSRSDKNPEVVKIRAPSGELGELCGLYQRGLDPWAG
jgi:hypothetical protein